MPHNKITLTRAWCAKAMNDLQTTERLLEGDRPLIESAVFHVQQAAEKAIKGFLSFHEISFRKTHDIGVLRATSRCD